MKLSGGALTEGFNRVAHAYDLLVSLNPGYRRHLRLSARRLARADSAPANGLAKDSAQQGITQTLK